MKHAALFCGCFLAVQPAFADPSLQRGEYLVTGPAGCGNCHSPQDANGFIAGQELSGRLVLDIADFTAYAPNITPAGDVARWSDADVARAIREGRRPDGSLIGPPMPFEMYRGLSDDDVMSIVAYLRSVPPVTSDVPKSTYNIPLPPDYGPPITSVAAVPPGVSVEYGAYLAGPVAHCMECHTPMGPEGLLLETRLGAGGFEIEGPWGVSVTSNITPTGLARFSDAQLDQMIRHGINADGEAMLPPMPYSFLARMTDEDLAAIILYLRSLPPLPDTE